MCLFCSREQNRNVHENISVQSSHEDFGPDPHAIQGKNIRGRQHGTRLS